MLSLPSEVRSAALLALVMALAPSNALNVEPGFDTLRVGKAANVTVQFDTELQPHKWALLEKNSTVETPVCIDAPVEGCSYDEMFENYKLFLASENWYLCTLTPLLKTGDNQTVEITIPANIGPDSDTYSIVGLEFNGEVPYMPAEGLTESSKFNIQGSTVKNWTSWEQDGGWVKPYGSIPCESYGCYRQCGLDWSDGSGKKGSDTAPMFFDCVNKCRDVKASYDEPSGPWNWYRATTPSSNSTTDPDTLEPAHKKAVTSYSTVYATPTIVVSASMTSMPVDVTPVTYTAEPTPTLTYGDGPAWLSGKNCTSGKGCKSAGTQTMVSWTVIFGGLSLSLFAFW